MAPSPDPRRQAGAARADGVYRPTVRDDKSAIGPIVRPTHAGRRVVQSASPDTCVDVGASGILLPTIPDSSTVERPAVNR